MKNKLGKNTPVWRNKNTGVVVCGRTIQEALGVSYYYNVGSDWEQVNRVPRTDRVVIDSDGEALPRNDLICAIARGAKEAGPLTVNIYGKYRTFNLRYVSPTKVIIAE